MPQQIRSITGSGVPLLLDDIDTDRIIPARFLRCVTFDGLGEHSFEDDRQQDPGHPFNKPEFREGSVLVAGRNFGCGSSREHAPQALMRWGIKAIVAESFAEIFFGNCGALGIPCVRASRADLERLSAVVAADPTLPVTVDLDILQVIAGPVTCHIEMPDGPRTSLMTGNWDFLGQLLEGADAVKTATGKLPYMSGFKA
jgi:3-isopropylmalate/(R)-2-methylmalate dehydratase small subunit